MNTTIKKLSIAALIAGILLGGYGLVTASASYEAAAPPPTTQGTTALQPIGGLAPIEEVVDLFRERSNDHPLDYINRTYLGAALNTQARENANLAGFAEAEAVLQEALDLNPRWTPAKLALAGSLHSQHEFADALALATEVAETNPNELSALALIGDANFELGNYAVARANYDDLASIERSAPTLSRLARMAWVQGDRAGAIELADEALMLSNALPQRANASAFYWFQLGHFQSKDGQTEAAIASFEAALEIDPESSAAKEALAQVLYAAGDYEPAAALYAELIESGPAPDLYGSYADLLDELGDPVRAADFAAQGEALAIETMDDFPAERRHLVGFFLKRDPALALELARADLDDRRDVGAYDTLAWALFHTGDYVEAQDAIDAALTEGTQDPSFFFHAAAIADANGDSDAASTFAQRALDIDANFHPYEADAARALVGGG